MGKLIRHLMALINILIITIAIAIFIIPTMIVNRIGTSSVRVRCGRLQTPMCTYINSVSGRMVVFIGTCHIGSVEYYARINETLHDLETHNMVVLYEEVERDGESNDFLSDVVSLRKSRAGRLGLVVDRHHVEIKPDWIRADVLESELTERLRESVGEDTLITPDDLLSAYFRWLSGTHFWFRESFNLKTVMRWYATIVTLGLVKLKHKEDNDIISWRDEVATKAIAEHDQSADVAILYGSNHRPGIEKSLLNRGYVLSEITWLNVT